MTKKMPFRAPVAACLLLAWLGQAFAAAPTMPRVEPLVSNSFYETDLRQALGDIAHDTGVTIMAAPEVRGFVTCDLDGLPLRQALRQILAGTGYGFVERDGYFLVTSLDPKSSSFAESSSSRVRPMRYRTAKAAMSLLPEHLRRYVSADEESNAVLVSAPDIVLAQVLNTLDTLDTPSRQVLLDARVVVMEHGKLMEMGLKWDFPQAAFGAYTGSGIYPSWPWELQIGLSPSQAFTQSLMLTLNLLEQNQEATIMATPQVMAQDGKPAELKVATEEYFRITTAGYYERIDLEKIETGTILAILPRVGQEGDITLDISAEVSNVVARADDGLPVVTRRTARSTVRVADGGTAAIAGLMDTRTRQRNDNVPVFSSLPLVGELFKHRSSINETKQIAVFVTARLVPDPADMAKQPPRARIAIAPVEKKTFRPQLEKALAASPR